MARFKNRWNFYVKNSNLVNIRIEFPAQNHILIYSINLIRLINHSLMYDLKGWGVLM